MTATLPHVGRARRWPMVGDPIYEGSRIPKRVPTIVDVPAALRETDDVLQVNFGPNHPSTHGVLRLIVDLDGEKVVGLSAVIGYLHTGFEKNMEQKTWWKAITYPERIDYVGYQNNELVFVLAIEKLLELEVPEKATWMRMLMCELNRIHSHLVFLGTSALELGAISMFWYCFRERETILDLFELVAGQRMHTRYFQAGGLAEDIPAGFYPEARSFVERMPHALDDYLTLLDRNKIWLERTQGVGLLSADDAIALGQSGPVLRASGVDWDLRRDAPYLAYDQVDFRVPVYNGGDVYDRYRVRMDEMAESTQIVRQCIDRLERMEGSPGSRTTARSCSRPARSCTRRWSRSSTTSRSSPRGIASPPARSTSRSSRRAASPAATSSATAARGRGACTSAPRRSRRSRRPRRARRDRSSPT